jgi:hypothetical protein
VVIERMKKDNAEVLAGKIAHTPHSSCTADRQGREEGGTGTAGRSRRSLDRGRYDSDRRPGSDAGLAFGLP